MCKKYCALPIQLDGIELDGIQISNYIPQYVRNYIFRTYWLLFNDYVMEEKVFHLIVSKTLTTLYIGMCTQIGVLEGPQVDYYSVNQLKWKYIYLTIE